jgi:hypothetical protein
MRIARAGYIETPSPFYEQGYNYPHADRGWSFHRWFVYLGEGETLTFEPKTERSIDDFCDCRHGQFIKRMYRSHEGSQSAPGRHSQGMQLHRPSLAG